MKKTYKIGGMHCVSCSTLLTEELAKLPGVAKADVSHQKGTADLEFTGQADDRKVAEAVAKAGYSVIQEGASGRSRKIGSKEIFQNIAIFLAVALSLTALSRLGIQKYFPALDNNANLLTAVGIGVVASLSTCLALTGGIIMGMSAKIKARKEDASVKELALPQFYFHGGRLGGFFLLGGALGAIGNAIDYSLSAMSALTALVALVMFYLGLNIMGFVPNITRFGFHLPASFAKKVKSQENGTHAFVPALLGVLTFFLPCGFTQSMQLLAVSSGSFLKGGLIMLFFALGTLPVLFSVGLGSSLASGPKFKLAKKFIGALVIFFALFSLNNAIVLAGGNIGLNIPNKNNGGEKAAENDGKEQVVRLDIDNVFMQDEFTVLKGVPVKWEINAIHTTGCSNEVIIPRLGISSGKLKDGINIVRFTPTETGTLPFSCWMGMQTGKFNVIDKPAAAKADADNKASDGDAVCDTKDSCASPKSNK